MAPYNTSNVKLSNSQIIKLKSGIKNGTEMTLKVSSNIICDSKLLLTNTQVARLHKAFWNISSANIKFSKTLSHDMGKLEWLLGRILEALLKIGLSVIGNVLKELPKIALIPLQLTPAASATNVAIHKYFFGSGTTALIISTEEMNNIMKIVKSFEESGLLIKSASETIKN